MEGTGTNNGNTGTRYGTPGYPGKNGDKDGGNHATLHDHTTGTGATGMTTMTLTTNTPHTATRSPPRKNGKHSKPATSYRSP